MTMPSVSQRRTFVRFRVCGVRRQADHPAVPGRPAGPRPSEVRERDPAPGAHGVGHVRRGPGALGAAVADVGGDPSGRGSCPRYLRAGPRPVRRRARRDRHRTRRRTRHRADPGERGGGYCCGLDGAAGPNVACAACALPVASRIDDCSLWQAVWLAPNAVRRRPVDGADAAPLSWAELMAEGKGTPPFEPIAAWGSRLGAVEPLVVVEPAVGGGSRPGTRPPAGGLGRPAGDRPGRPDRGGVPTRARRPAARGSAGAARRPGRTGTAGSRRGRRHPPRAGPSTDGGDLGPGRPGRLGVPGAAAVRGVAVAGLPRAGPALPRVGRHARRRPPRRPARAARPATCSGPTRERSSTPWSGCRPSAARGCARSSRT